MAQLKAIERFEAKYIPEPNSGCWLWTAYVHPKTGYGLFTRLDGSQGSEGAHRASWMLHNGEIPNNLHVLHHCDVRCCVNPDHLFLGDALINSHDAKSKGRLRYTPRRVLRGEEKSQAKLNWDKVIEIRSSTETATALAKRFGVSFSLIASIRRNQNWKQ
jgi:hypothetical protein